MGGLSLKQEGNVSFDQLADLLPIAAQISGEVNAFVCMTHLIDYGLMG